MGCASKEGVKIKAFSGPDTLAQERSQSWNPPHRRRREKPVVKRSRRDRPRLPDEDRDGRDHRVSTARSAPIT
jgi:hypothetical protein